MTDLPDGFMQLFHPPPGMIATKRGQRGRLLPPVRDSNLQKKNDFPNQELPAVTAIPNFQRLTNSAIAVRFCFGVQHV